MSASASNDFCTHCARHADQCGCHHCAYCAEHTGLEHEDAAEFCADCSETACEWFDCTNTGTPEEVTYVSCHDVRACSGCRKQLAEADRKRERMECDDDYLYDQQRDALLRWGDL